jgi:hypothetical protein
VAGGFPIYQFTDNGWVQVPGGAVTITVAPDGTPFVINSAHNTYERIGSSWVQGPGALTDIAFGADGSLWGVGIRPVPGGFPVYQFTDNGWAGVAGGAVTITVGPTGRPWVINSSNRVFAS